MKKVLFALAAFFLLAAWTTSKNQMDNGGRTFVVTLTGEAEVNGAGDPDAEGTAILTFNQGQGTLTYQITVSGVDGTISGAHIHRAPEGSPGPVVIPLTAPATGNSTSSGVVSVSKELIKDIRQNPENYYINVHSLPDYGPGAVRGQLSK